MKTSTTLKYAVPSIIIGLFMGGIALAELFYPNDSSYLQPVDDSWGIYTPANLRFDGEIQPDGATCSNGQILKKTGANNWDCATDSTAAGGGATTTITTGVGGATFDGPDFTFATGTMTGLNLLITGSGSTITYTPQLQTGYNIPRTASTTNWNNFYDTPSTRITAGSYLTWSGNTLNASSSPYFTSVFTTGSSTLASTSIVGVLNVTGNITGGNLSGTNTGDVTLAGQNYLSLSGQQITAAQINLGSHVTSVLPLANGGTATTTAPTQAGQLLTSHGTTWGVAALLAGSNITITTSTLGQITIASSGGGSGNAAWTILNGRIHNATSTDEVGIGTTTPDYTLTIQGNSSTSPLRIASSTGTNLLTLNTDGNLTVLGTLNAAAATFTTVDTGQGANELYDMDQNVLTTSDIIFAAATTTGITKLATTTIVGSTTITSLGAANCDVKSIGGALACGTDQSGSSTGNAAWTILSGVIHNATSTDEVGIGTSTPDFTLTVQGNGTTNPLRIASSSGANFFQVLAEGRTQILSNASDTPVLYIGPSSTPLSAFQLGNVILETKESRNLLVIAAHGGSAVNSTPGVNTYQSRGNAEVPSASQANDDIYFMGGRGYGATAYGSGTKVAIRLQAAQNWTDSAQGTQIVFETVENNGTTRVERMRISDAGFVGIGSTTPIALLSVQGRTSSTTPLMIIATSTGSSILQVTSGSQILVCTTCRLTVPQGTAPTLSAAGDVGVDTSNGGMFSFIANGRENLVATTSKAAYIENPTASDDIILYQATQPTTITKVTCSIRSTVSHVPSWTFSMPHDTTVVGGANNAMTVGQACTGTTTPSTITIGGDLTLAAGEMLRATSSAVSNASSTFIQFELKFDN